MKAQDARPESGGVADEVDRRAYEGERRMARPKLFSPMRPRPDGMRVQFSSGIASLCHLFPACREVIHAWLAAARDYPRHKMKECPSPFP